MTNTTRRWVSARTIGGLAIGCLLAVPAVSLASRLTQHWEATAKAFDEHKFTLAKAVELAEAHSKGRAVSVHTVILNEKFRLWVHCAVGNNCAIVRVDPKTSKADEMTVGVPADLSCRTAETTVKLMDEHKIDIVKAAAKAEAASQGKVVAAMTEVVDDALQFVFVTVVGEKGKLVTVAAKTGEVTKTEDAPPGRSIRN